MPTVNPYLNFGGNAEEAFNFYQSVFGGDFAMVMRFKDAPSEFAGQGKDENRIMHIALPIGPNTILMGSDISSEMPPPQFGDNIHISYTADSKDNATTIYNKLSQGGTEVMSMQNTFWGSYFGMLKDRFGINWMISFDEAPPQS